MTETETWVTWIKVHRGTFWRHQPLCRVRLRRYQEETVPLFLNWRQFSRPMTHLRQWKLSGKCICIRTWEWAVLGPSLPSPRWQVIPLRLSLLKMFFLIICRKLHHSQGENVLDSTFINSLLTWKTIFYKRWLMCLCKVI